MGERYLVTGVQLGMLIGIEDISERKDLVEDIISEQSIYTSSEDIIIDCDMIRKLLSNKGV